MAGQFEENRIEHHSLRTMPGTDDTFLILTSRIMEHLGIEPGCTGDEWLKATFCSNGILISRRGEDDSIFAPFEKPVEIVIL